MSSSSKKSKSRRNAVIVILILLFVLAFSLSLGLGLGLGLQPTTKAAATATTSAATATTSAATITCTTAEYLSNSTCLSKKTNGANCNSTMECQDFNSLSCQNDTCICPDSTWGWSTAQQKCIQCTPVAGSQIFYSVASQACVTCPSTWTIYLEHCYYINTNLLTYAAALTYCESFNATMMIVRNDVEYNLLYNFYQTYVSGSSLVVGAISTVVDDFRWPDNTQLPKNSSWWCSGEPNNSGGTSTIVTEGCTQMITTSNKICFNDIPCSNPTTTACEKYQ